MEEKINILSLKELKASLVSFQQNDTLVNIHAKTHLWERVDVDSMFTTLEVPFNKKWEKLYRRFYENYRETGVQTACWVSKTIVWKFKDTEIETPFVLHPLEVQRDKNRQKLLFSGNDQPTFINPFIEKYFSEQFDIQLSFEKLNEQEQQLSLNPRIVDFVDVSIIGQFHYHRFLYLKELEEVECQEKSPLLNKIFGETSSIDSVLLPDGSLLPTDPTQDEVLKAVGKDSFVLQGPPGTGKSQVLINIIGKLLRTTDLNVVVSEKKSALDVIQKKLERLGLNDFLVCLDDQTELKSIYRQFQSTWTFLETLQPSSNSSFSTTEFDLAHLQLLLDRIQNEELSGGISYWKLKELSARISDGILPDLSHRFTYKEWIESKTLIEQLSDIPFSFWNVFEQKFWKKENFKMFQKWIENYAIYNTVFELSSVDDIEELSRWCVISQIQESKSYDDFIAIVRSKTKWKNYRKLKKNYLNLSISVENIQKKTELWEFVPTIGQIVDWVKLTKNFWGRKKLRKILDKVVSPGISLDTVTQISHEYWEVTMNLDSCRQQLIEFGIFNPEQDFAEMEILSQRNKEVDDSFWKSFGMLSSQKIRFLRENLQEIVHFSSFSRTFLLKNVQNLQNLIVEFKANLSLLESKLSAIQAIPPSLYFWMNHRINWQQVELQIITNEWQNFRQLFPELSTLEIDDLKRQIENIIKDQEFDRDKCLNEILQYRKNAFLAYEKILLQTPSKLTENEKQFRKELKKGKSILVKEMTKSKQFLPLRDLWESEARHWLQVLTPIWLLTPTQLAKNFPLRQQFFRFALIDEASQIPISHLVGTLQRATQAVIAGDSQQMTPSNFFQTEEATDILSIAPFYFNNYTLKYHYRSNNDALIRFSNQYFYENELEVFPVFHSGENEPLEWVLVDNAIYSDNRNVREAKVVAERIKTELSTSKQLGIVAFSERQLEEIWKNLDGNSQLQLENRIDDNTAFFKALDKVQGDECDVLLISLGYGKNEVGDFHLHLGPILKEKGERRLNVLFSRAKEKIVFFTSVRPEDFPLSDNISVDLLRKYLLEISKKDISQPVKPNLIKWLRTIKSSHKLVAKYRIYKERGWDL